VPTEARKNGSKAPRVLIVDDDPGQRSLLDSFLRSQGFDTVVVTSGERALEILRTEKFSMMISDVRMPGMSGLETMRRAREEHVALPVLLVTAYTDIREAVGAMRDGAVNYLGKPIDLDELLANVRQATGLAKSAPMKFSADKQLPPHVVGRSPLTLAVFRDASLIAASESRVLITGESGVGKEVLVDVIHAWSTRSSGPLVKVNCAAIPETPLESELFGHEKGAFIARLRSGSAVEQANDGTIFLDEIADMSTRSSQTAPRHAKTVASIASARNTELQTNARILAPPPTATLEDKVKAGCFREDLFYRLNVVELNMPPLRERREDILPLAGLFHRGIYTRRAFLKMSVAGVPERYPWPGNVRELRKCDGGAAALLAQRTHFASNTCPRACAGPTCLASAESSDPQRLGEIERQAIFQTLRKHNFNRTETAKALGISRRALIYKLQHFREQGYEVDPV
jgi:DNA-binding NtrC family response regulator